MKVKPRKKAAKPVDTEPTVKEEAVVAAPELNPAPAVLTPDQVFGAPSRFDDFRWWVRRVWTRFHRLFPRLVWYNDEIDVRLVFTEDRLRAFDDAIEDSSKKRTTKTKPIIGPITEAAMQLHKAGIGFDVGIGVNGRDWHFDYSLRGPVRVKFVGKAVNPVLRQVIVVGKQSGDETNTLIQQP